MTDKPYPNARDCEHGCKRGSCELCNYEQEIAALHKTIAAQQARIDALMLEYCHDEMTTEQLAAWQTSQRHSNQD